MKRRALKAFIAAAALAMLGAETTAVTQAHAATTVASTFVSKAGSAGYKHSPAVKMGHNWAGAVTKTAKAGVTMRPSSVSPLASHSPACYGDSRSISPVGGSFDPVSFGAFYNCTQGYWTFELQTADTWAASSFGDFSVGINTDGDVAGTYNCGGVNYIATVYQNLTSGYGPTGTFTATVAQVDSSCNAVTQVTVPESLTSDTATISFPTSAIANNNSFAWQGYIQSFTEWSQFNQSGGATFNADNVPDSGYVDDVVQGAVIESIPAPYSGFCPAAYVGQSDVASTNNSSVAVAALKNAGMQNVHSNGEGVVSFTGDTAAAERALSAAGLNAQVAQSHRFSELTSGTTTAPNDPGYSNGSQWNLPAIGAPGAWAVTTGNNIVVADIDSGVDYTNADLSPNLLPGFDETTGKTMGPVGSTAQETGNLDSDGHGTAVAGIIAAATNNSTGLASLGWNTKVLPVKIDLSQSAEVEAGIKWAADNGAKVINLSFGSPCNDSSVLQGIQYAQSKGALMVAAAGNAAIYSALDTANGINDAPIYPAADSGVLAVGATGQDGFRAPYSETGNYVSIVAPSGNGNGADNIPVLAATSGGCTNSPTNVCLTSDAGTSFAAPQVAATAALILSVNPSLTASQVSQLITGSATDLGPSGNDIEYGAGMLNAAAALADTPPSTSGYGTFVSVPPARILDTRFGTGGVPTAPLGPGQTISLKVTGAGGVPASGVTAVVMNTTVTNATQGSFLTVWPTGQNRPNASNINFLSTQTVPNLVTVKVGSGGDVSFYNAAGSTDVLADVSGYYVDGTGSPGSTFVPVAPTRILDTRSNGGPVAGGTSRDLDVVAASGGLVPSNATGIVANVTITTPTANSYLTAYPSGTPVPNASNLNFVANQTVPNLVSVELGSGHVSFFNAAGNVQVIVDLQGYFTAAGDTSGSRYFPLVNHRILDDRFDIGGFYGPITQSQSIPVAVVGQGGVLDGAASVVMNATVTAPTQLSYLTVYPDGTSVPYASNLNFNAGQTIANLVTAKIGSDGDDGFYNANGSVYAIADVVGYYGSPGA